MAYADYRKTRVRRTEEEILKQSIKFVKYAINKHPEHLLSNFESFRNTGSNRKGLESLGIYNVNDLQNYIDSKEA